MTKTETMKEAGYKYGGFIPEFGAHRLIDIETGKKEMWAANFNHAGYRIKWRNTHLEFVTSLGGER